MPTSRISRQSMNHTGFLRGILRPIPESIRPHGLVIDKAKLISNNKMCWRLNLNPSSEEATSVLFHIIAIPVRQSVRLLINDLTRLQGVRTAFIDWGRRIEKMA